MKLAKELASALGFYQRLDQQNPYTLQQILDNIGHLQAINIKDWQKKSGNLYRAALRSGLIGEVSHICGWNNFRHFKSFEEFLPRVIQINAKSLSDWRAKCCGSYRAACKKGLQTEVAKYLNW